MLLLFFDHGGEFLHQRARFLLLLLGMDEDSFEVLQLRRQSIASLFHLNTIKRVRQRSQASSLKSLSNKAEMV